MSIAAYEDGFDTCEATGKRIYISASKAHVYAHRIQTKNKRNVDRHAVHVYECDECGSGRKHFHIGHTTSGVKKQKRPACVGEAA